MMNLHVYSHYSGKDYSSPTKQLLQEYQCGKFILSITDHNCVKANAVAQTLAKEYGFIYISGIEIDCTYENRNISVIGYGIDANSRDFAEVDEKTDGIEYYASLERLCETQTMGFHITEYDMWNIAKNQYHPGNWTGKMFAEILFSKPEYYHHPLLQKYRISSESRTNYYEAFSHDFYSEGALCYVKIDYMHVSEAINIIHQNGGKAVLGLSGFNKITNDDIKKLFNYKIDFIDFYGNYFMEREKNELSDCLSRYIMQNI